MFESVVTLVENRKPEKSLLWCNNKTLWAFQNDQCQKNPMPKNIHVKNTNAN